MSCLENNGRSLHCRYLLAVCGKAFRSLFPRMRTPKKPRFSGVRCRIQQRITLSTGCSGHRQPSADRCRGFRHFFQADRTLLRVLRAFVVIHQSSNRCGDASRIIVHSVASRLSKSIALSSRGCVLPAGLEAEVGTVHEQAAAGDQAGAGGGRVGKVELVGGQGRAGEPEQVVASPNAPDLGQPVDR